MSFDDYLSKWLKQQTPLFRFRWYWMSFWNGMILRIEIAFNAIFKRGAK
jgi:hypothetical protein